jgi:two-component system, OmpR family, response regulator
MDEESAQRRATRKQTHRPYAVLKGNPAMLVLSRKLKEKIVLPTLGTAIQVLEIKRGVVRLGIDAPPEVRIFREEIPDRKAEWGEKGIRPESRPAAEGGCDNLARQVHDRLKATGVCLGLLRLQMEAGLTEDAKATLAALHQDFQLLLHGVEGELEHRSAKPPANALRRQKALLVEDDNIQRELLAGFLRQSGMDVDTAGDGADALDYLHSHSKPDVVLLDMGLPRVDGPTVVRRIRGDRAFAGLKIFGVTAHLPNKFDLASGPAGIDRWFHKPLDPAVLLRDLTRELEAIPVSSPEFPGS